jgi:hypothetical protein
LQTVPPCSFLNRFLDKSIIFNSFEEFNEFSCNVSIQLLARDTSVKLVVFERRFSEISVMKFASSLKCHKLVSESNAFEWT